MNPSVATRFLVVLLILLTMLVGAPTSAHATIPVWDYIEYALQFLKWVWQYASDLWAHAKIEYAQYQRVQMIYNQAQQIVLQVKALKSWGRDGDFTTLNGAMGQIDSLFNQLDSLGYLTVDIYRRWAESFPGLVPPQQWVAEEKARQERIRRTMGAHLKALNRLSENQTHSQVVLAQLAERARNSDSPQTQLEVANMYHLAAGYELTKLVMTTSLTANSFALFLSQQTQREESGTAAREAWLLSAPLPSPLPDARDRFTGLPTGYLLPSLP